MQGMLEESPDSEGVVPANNRRGRPLERAIETETAPCGQGWKGEVRAHRQWSNPLFW